MASPTAPTAVPVVRSEWAVVLLIAAVQFINILDFVMVMPLGPILARALAIPESNIGFIGGSYTASAAVAGLLGMFVLERFDRRKALAVAMLGLVAGTAAGSVATGMTSMLFARVLAGFFGGPATSLCFAIIADLIPPSRRGRAMGVVMGAFSVASIVGVPTGLWLAERFSWRAPFVAVALLGLVVVAGAIVGLPPLRKHLEGARQSVSVGGLLRLLARPTVQLSYVMTAATMMAGFMLIPNIAAYVTGNLGLPYAHLKYMYLLGGIVSLLVMQWVGRLVDSFGSFRVGTFGSLLLVIAIYIFFVHSLGLPVLALFITFMTAMSFRNVAYNTLTSKVPGPTERARFQSMQSAVQHGASSVGAILSAHLLGTRLVEGPGRAPVLAADGQPLRALVHMPQVALVSICLSLLLPVLLFWVEKRVRAEQPASER